MMSVALLLAVALSAGNAEFEREANRLAADVALTRLKAEFAERGLGTNALECAMLARPEDFRTRSDAEHLCREIYTNALDRLYRVRADVIARELGDDVVARAPDAQTLDEASRRHFAREFSGQRASACAKQAQGLALKVKPDEADLESKDEGEVRAWLTDRIANARGTPVFEENLSYISEKIVDPILADARKERKRQQDYLMRTRCDAYSPTALATEIEGNLRKDVAERKSKCTDPIKAWGVFPSTLRTSLPFAVERRILGLARKEIDNVPLDLDEERIRRTIAADPSAHRRKTDSEKTFGQLLSKDLLEAAFRKAESSAPPPEREAFAAYVRERAGSPEFSQAVETRVRRQLLPKWRKVREELAQAETARRWPTLVDRTWYPDAELADKTAARSDYAKAVRNWRRAPELSSLAGTGETLEEAGAAADTAVAAAFDLARNAVAAQHAIVAKVHPSVLTAARDLSRGFFTRKPDLEKVTEMLTEAVEGDWNENRVGILWGEGPKPANFEEQHKELFPSVKREIELVARQILEEMQKEEKDEDEAQKKAKDESPTPEEPPTDSDSSASSDMSTDSELCTISFEVADGEVTVQATKGKSVIAERKAKATAKGFEDAVRKVGAIVGREIFKLR